MFHILKNCKLDSVIVGKVTDKIAEYDDEVLGRIFEEIGCEKETLLKKLYNPYYVSESEKPDFEIYRFKKELK